VYGIGSGSLTCWCKVGTNITSSESRHAVSVGDASCFQVQEPIAGAESGGAVKDACGASRNA
jgi:hypothetical protein